MVQNTGWQSVRTVFEVLAAAGILWMARSISAQNESLVRIQEQIANLQVSVANVPVLTTAVAQLQVQVAEHDRRINQIETAKKGINL
jgi:hypothetical protein